MPQIPINVPRSAAEKRDQTIDAIVSELSQKILDSIRKDLYCGEPDLDHYLEKCEQTIPILVGLIDDFNKYRRPFAASEKRTQEIQKTRDNGFLAGIKNALNPIKPEREIIVDGARVSLEVVREYTGELREEIWNEYRKYLEPFFVYYSLGRSNLDEQNFSHLEKRISSIDIPKFVKKRFPELEDEEVQEITTTILSHDLLSSGVSRVAGESLDPQAKQKSDQRCEELFKTCLFEVFKFLQASRMEAISP